MVEVYLILNTLNGNVYIGQSVNLKVRWGQHRYSLRNSKHHCPHLQRAWSKYGEESFDWIVVESNLSQEEANLYEQAYIEWYAGLELAYNPTWRHKGKGKMSAEQISRISENHKRLGIRPPTRKGISPSLEAIEKQKQTYQKNAPPKKKHYCSTCGNEKSFYYRKYCDKCLDKARKDYAKTRICSEEQRKKISESKKGIFPSQESKKKISESSKGKVPKNLTSLHEASRRTFTVVDPEGNVITASGLTKFALEHNLHRRMFRDLLSGKIKVYKGWTLPQE